MAFAPIGANGISPQSTLAAMRLPPLRRLPPYACVALAMLLVGISLADQMGALWWYFPGWAGAMVAIEAWFEVRMRQLRRKHRIVRCPSCARHTLDLAFEVLGWCLACGTHGKPQLPPEPAPLGPRRPAG